MSFFGFGKKKTDKEKEKEKEQQIQKDKEKELEKQKEMDKAKQKELEKQQKEKDKQKEKDDHKNHHKDDKSKDKEKEKEKEKAGNDHDDESDDEVVDDDNSDDEHKQQNRKNSSKSGSAASPSSPESGPTSPNPKKIQRFGLRTKKFWATKTAGTKMGRRVIAMFLGEEGNNILSTVKEATRKDAGSSKASEIKTNILTLALKAKVLQDERLITKRDVWLFTEPINNLGVQLYVAMKPKLTENGKRVVVDVGPLVAEIVKVKELCYKLVKTHMREKNSEKLKAIFEYLGSTRFLNLLLNDPKYEEERTTIYLSIRKIIKPILDERKYEEGSSLQLCKKEGCYEYALEGNGYFRGSNHCIYHHNEILEGLLHAPTVAHFLTGEGRDYFPFQSDVKTHIARYIRKLWIVIQQYKSMEKLSVRNVAAKEIYNKYIKKNSSHYVPMSDATYERFEKSLRDDPTNLKVFDDVEKDLYGRMEEYFQKQWKNTANFKDYLATFQIPSYLQKELARAKDEVKKGTWGKKKPPEGMLGGDSHQHGDDEKKSEMNGRNDDRRARSGKDEKKDDDDD